MKILPETITRKELCQIFQCSESSIKRLEKKSGLIEDRVVGRRYVRYWLKKVKRRFHFD